MLPKATREESAFSFQSSTTQDGGSSFLGGAGSWVGVGFWVSQRFQHCDKVLATETAFLAAEVYTRSTEVGIA